MARDWESTFRDWSKPSSDTEADKSANAESMIRDAIRASNALQRKTIDVSAQGSYRNNTNVRHDSDVDICVRCMDAFYPDYTHGATDRILADAHLVSHLLDGRFMMQRRQLPQQDPLSHKRRFFAHSLPLSKQVPTSPRPKIPEVGLGTSQ